MFRNFTPGRGDDVASASELSLHPVLTAREPASAWSHMSSADWTEVVAFDKASIDDQEASEPDGDNHFSFVSSAVGIMAITFEVEADCPCAPIRG